MPEPRLHLDADTSSKALHAALVTKGHDVTRTPAKRTPSEWMGLDADDEGQLLGATAHGRCIFSFNVRDFVALAKRYPHHAGIRAELATTLKRRMVEAGEVAPEIRPVEASNAPPPNLYVEPVKGVRKIPYS